MNKGAALENSQSLRGGRERLRVPPKRMQNRGCIGPLVELLAVVCWGNGAGQGSLSAIDFEALNQTFILRSTPHKNR